MISYYSWIAYNQLTAFQLHQILLYLSIPLIPQITLTPYIACPRLDQLFDVVFPDMMSLHELLKISFPFFAQKSHLTTPYPEI